MAPLSFLSLSLGLLTLSHVSASAIRQGAANPPKIPNGPPYNGTVQSQAIPYAPQPALLTTDWTASIDPSNHWTQHPRPNLKRDDKWWQTLNGIWRYKNMHFASSAFTNVDDLADIKTIPDLKKKYDGGPFGQAEQEKETLIPSCIESGFSGLAENNVTGMQFKRTLKIPDHWVNETGRKVLIHFEAVDYKALVHVNDHQLGENLGGYFRFTVDATNALNKAGEENELVVTVVDPTDEPGFYTPHGKQTRTPSHIFYTPCSGIWQSVWMESVPRESYVSDLDVVADMDGKGMIVTMTVHSSSNTTAAVKVSVLEDDKEVATYDGSANQEFSFQVPDAKLWSPDSPTLYNITITMGDDQVTSYTGFRTISKGVVNGIQRPLLNGKFVFQFGPLDQGYWPDGIYLPPTEEAMVWDLNFIKSLGMNMVRKHIKVEPQLYYHACDKLGLLVIQDMPSMRPAASQANDAPNPAQQAEFERQLGVMVTQFKHHPSIVTWVIYNEGWGQIREDGNHPEFRITDAVRALDPTRLIDSVTGWFDHGAGDFHDNHHYASPQCGTPWQSSPNTPYDPNRIGFQGEFGGVGHVPENTRYDNFPLSLWPDPKAIATIPETYELSADLDSFNYRTHVLLGELRDQVEHYACSGAVYTQTTDVEGEVNGLVTYDRRVVRINVTQWKEDIQALYDAAAKRS
ncbi:glycoside hydrolase [Sordaria brevicollis]|uniref:Glycoside hydrolase n=1 Tax=Sordaria brevicollis TaxID=83679 RepID=A0AAE0UB33_SORBR|nr:glycoside hydrolase [Sordaria brevicollis]